jgi:Flp pilus assembly protein TadG
VKRTTAGVRSSAGPPAPGAACRGRRVGLEPTAAGAVRRHRGERGSLSLESVMVLPVLALLVMGVLEVAAGTRDVLVVHEAARAGARAAATSTGTAPVVRAARDASPELDVEILVDPVTRRDGDVVRVSISSRRPVFGVQTTVRASAVARVEPAVGTRRPGVAGP